MRDFEMKVADDSSRSESIGDETEKVQISHRENAKYFPGAWQTVVACCQLLMVAGLVLMNGLLLNRMERRTESRRPSSETIASPALRIALGRYGDLIMQASSHYNVDPFLIRAVMLAESNERPRAVSHANARGLMQVMPATAADLGVEWIPALFDPETNITLGTKYLATQLKQFGGDVQKALIAYNAGPAIVLHGERLPTETRSYVPRVLELWELLQRSGQGTVHSG